MIEGTVKPIITNEQELNIKSRHLDIEKDLNKILSVSADLLATAQDKRDDCAGLAANQIGMLVRIIVVKGSHNYIPMVNPSFLYKTGGMVASIENCLSRKGQEALCVRRHKRVKVKYFCPNEKKYKRRAFNGFESRVVQHEIDHLNGVLV